MDICVTLIAIWHYIEAKFDYGYFIIFFALLCDLKILHKKSQDILAKDEGVMAIFPNFDLILTRKNQCHAFIFAQNNLRFFCVESRNHSTK